MFSIRSSRKPCASPSLLRSMTRTALVTIPPLPRSGIPRFLSSRYTVGVSVKSTVIFDLDGTITRPYINFDAIRAELGIASGTILEAMEKMPLAARECAEEIVLRHEWEAARNGDLYDDARDVLSACARAGYHTAVLTRNARPVVDFLLEKHGLHFDAIRTREDGAVKPSPAPVLSICEELLTPPRDCWMVGDYLYDILSGQSAGTHTALMIGLGAVTDYAGRADFLIRRLSELLPILGIADFRCCGAPP